MERARQYPNTSSWIKLESSSIYTILSLILFLWNTPLAEAQITPAPTIWTVSDGNWSDPSIWDSGTGSRLPNATDNVEIRHNVIADVSTSVLSINLDNSYAGSTRLIVPSGTTLQVTESTDYAISILGLSANTLLLNVESGGRLIASNDGPLYYERSCDCVESVRLLIDDGGVLTVGDIYGIYIDGGYSETTDELTFEGTVTTGSVFLQYDNTNGDSNFYAEVTGNGSWTVNGDLTLEPINGGSNAGDLVLQIGQNSTDVSTLHITGDLILNLNSTTSDPDDIRLRMNGDSNLIVDGELQLNHNSNESSERIYIALYNTSTMTLGSLSMNSTYDTNRVNNDFGLYDDSHLIVQGDINFSSYTSGSDGRRSNQILLDNNAILEIQGNVNSTDEGRFYFEGLNNTAWIYLTGSAQQTIPNVYAGPSSTGNDNSLYTGAYGNLYIENTSGLPVLLESDVIIRGSLNLVEGIVQSTGTETFTFADGSSTNIGADDAFITGPIHKLGTSDLTIPTGDTSWAPIGITNYNGGDATTVMEVQYSNSAPPDDGNLDPSLNLVSGLEHWPIQVVSGTVPTSVNVTLYWTDACASGIDDITVGELLVAMYNGGAGSPVWNISNLSSQAVGGGSEACDPMDFNRESGSISAMANDLANLTYMTLGSNGTLNALPVELINLRGSFLDSVVRLSWETISELDNEKFIVEKSEDSNEEFYEIGNIKGKGTSNQVSSYDFIDDSPTVGVAYYRIKQVDFDGTATYSNIISIEVQEATSFYAFPNPIPSNNKKFRLSKLCKVLEIYDSRGTLKHQYFNVDEISSFNLTKGIYFLRDESGNTVKVIVE